MSYKFSIISGILILIFSCNNPTKKPGDAPTSIKENPLNCYSYIKNNDTIILKTINVNGSMTGTLVYHYYQKDKNRGTIQGQMKGELLIADYSFASEGTQSVRQIVFKKKGDTFIEGFGEIEDINGKTTFKNIDSLDFNHSIILNEIPCND